MNNTFRNTVIYALEMSRRSKVPVIFISNPGYGKTTTINTYAKKNGYHVETVCGSQYSKDEILGYLVNEGGESLTAKAPEWYTNIKSKEKEKIPSILFFDEISAASTEVQSSLLQVCFERKIRGGRRLPDDCIICAAANYKLNLPGWCDIMAPELNRFCIINLQSSNDLDVIDEFTQDFTEVDDEWPEIPNIEPTKTSDTKVLNLMNKFFHGLWKKYPRDLSSKVGQTIGALNLNNQRFDGMYSDNDTGVGQVLNFISGRNMSYICRAFKALYTMGLDGNDPSFVSLVMDGMMGGGTNSWSEDPEERVTQINQFRELIHKKGCEILQRCAGGVNSLRNKESVVYASDLQGKILETMNAYESGDAEDIDEDISLAMTEVEKKYSKDIKKSLSFLDGSVEKMGEFTSDYEAMLRLENFLKDSYEGSSSIQDVSKRLRVVLKTYMAYYQMSFVESSK